MVFLIQQLKYHCVTWSWHINWCVCMPSKRCCITIVHCYGKNQLAYSIYRVLAGLELDSLFILKEIENISQI